MTSVIVFIKSIIPDIETINNLIYVILVVKAGRHKKVFDRSRVWGKRNPHQENSEVERGAKWHNVKHEWILLLKDLPSHITKGLGKKIQGEIEKN